jgi:hypothetical protein
MSELPPDKPSIAAGGADSGRRKAAAPDARSEPQCGAGKSSNPANDNLVDQAIALWQPRVGRDLSREDARQILENVRGFFKILAEWSRDGMVGPANDNGAEEDKRSRTGTADDGEEGRSMP